MPRHTDSSGGPQAMSSEALQGEPLRAFYSRASEHETPDALLNALNDATSQACQVHVLGAARFPAKIGDLESMKLGESMFLHKDVPRGWWQDYLAYGQQSHDPGVMKARVSLVPSTWTEMRRMVEPVGADRWPMDLALKHGMRDGFTCPVGGRWVVVYWSRKVLSGDVFSPEMRALIFLASAVTIMRLEALTTADAGHATEPIKLTPRESAVLGKVAAGLDLKAIAKALELGEETIRTHLSKAKTKLKARNRTQAVAEAIRQRIIP